jgi:hypothetical protein
MHTTTLHKHLRHNSQLATTVDAFARIPLARKLDWEHKIRSDLGSCLTALTLGSHSIFTMFTRQHYSLQARISLTNRIQHYRLTYRFPPSIQKTLLAGKHARVYDRERVTLQAKHVNDFHIRTDRPNPKVVSSISVFVHLTETAQ